MNGRPEAPPEFLPLVESVRAAAARHRLFGPGASLLVAVSGGPDSVALLHALTCLRDDLALTLAVGHVHHGLRAEADRDAAFVRGLAARLDCPVAVEAVQVPQRPDGSPETAARAARYAALARLARAAGASRIVTAHTADDQAETVLMRLLQGAGPRGLAGIPARRGAVVRPLLEVDRAAVLAHLAAHGLPWVQDATNLDTKILRNRIRHELLPLLGAQGWPGFPAALRRTAAASRELSEALDALLAPRVAALMRPGPGGLVLDLAPLCELPPGALKAALRLALVDLAPAPELRAGLRAGHFRALAALADAPVGARVRLPAGLGVERGRDALWVTRGAPADDSLPLAVPGETRLPAFGGRLVVERTLLALEAPPPDPAGEVWLDAGALPGPLRVRPRRPGDRLVPFGHDRPVRVARLLAATGAPPSVRNRWPLLVAPGADGEAVLWVIGVRRGAVAPVRRETRTVLRVRLHLDPVRGPEEEST
jgi:tRNA(Ile)-lysidine synthase